jgi:hypothetical protein
LGLVRIVSFDHRSLRGSTLVQLQGLDVRQQPDDVTCGPTCLQALYAFHGEQLSLGDVIADVRTLPHGGTIGVLLGLDALARGYSATLFTYDLDVFDPSWFSHPRRDLRVELAKQLLHKSGLEVPSRAYMEFLDRGGVIRHRELTPDLLANMIRREMPPITALSATYLYGCGREVFEGRRSYYDDIRGEVVGHFIVISGVDSRTGKFRVSDPSTDNPLHRSGTYWVSPYRLIGAILLGAATSDGNLLIVRPGSD